MELSAKGNPYIYTPIGGTVTDGSTTKHYAKKMLWPAIVLAILFGLFVLDRYTTGLQPEGTGTSSSNSGHPLSFPNSAGSVQSQSSTSTSSSGTSSDTNLTVNGQEIAVPENGSVNTTADGANVSVQSRNQSSSSGNSKSVFSELKVKVEQAGGSLNVRLNN